MATWGYTKGIGPDTWAENFPAARGARQTPVNIETAKVKKDETLKSKPLKISYKAENTKNVTNNGHSFQTNIYGEGTNLEGGPLESKYQLVQFHFHWGKSDTTGSEHTVDGKQYASELHLVHWNTDKFSSVAEAIKYDKGLAVLGIFIRPGKEHAGFNKMSDLLSNIQYKGDTADIAGGFDPSVLLPANTESYWTYEGSLTTPPCYESVTWIVFKEPIEFSTEQLEKMRNLHSFCRGESQPDDEFSGHIMENYRPPLTLGERQIRAT